MGSEDQIRHTVVTAQNGCLKAWGRITRDTRDSARWRRLVRCAARGADHHSGDGTGKEEACQGRREIN